MNLRDNYFVKLIKYIKNVYDIDKQIEHISDKRINPTYKTLQIISLVLTGFLLRIKSFIQMNFMIKTGEFNNVCPSKKGNPKIDAIRKSLKSINLNVLRQIIEKTIKMAVRNKGLDGGTIDCLNVVAIDGTSLFSNQSPYCDDCILKRNRGKIYYSYSCAVMSLIGGGPSLVLDFEMNKHKNKANDTGEGELTAAKNLLSRVVTAHNGLIDVVAYDALACNSIFIKECVKLRVNVIVRVKKTTNISLKEVKRATNKRDRVLKFKETGYDIEVYESMFYMNDMDQPIRYIKYANEKKDGNKINHSQMLIITTCMDMKLETLYRIIKARWDIENKTFNNLKNNASLCHCFVH